MSSQESSSKADPTAGATPSPDSDGGRLPFNKTR